MSITFTCPACSRRFTLDDRLAGKRGKCKSCGEEIRVPDLEGPPDLLDTDADDPYGLDDLPSTSTAAPMTGAARDKEALAVRSIPTRGRERTAWGKKTAKRTKSGAGPWGVELRRTACACLFFGLFASRALRVVPLEFRSNPFVSLVTFATLALMGLGSLLTVVAIAGTSVSLNEQLVLVIRSAKGRGELDNLHQVRFQRSGTIHASSFMARPEDGPYEAWVEVSSLPGRSGQRKQVSSPVALQFTDMPAVDPGAAARAAAEAQRRQMMIPGQVPGMGPGMPPPGRVGPMGPGPMGPGRMGPGPMGPRGGRFPGGPR